MSVLFPRYLFSVLNHIPLPFLLCPLSGEWGRSPERWQKRQCWLRGCRGALHCSFLSHLSPTFCSLRNSHSPVPRHVSFMAPRCSQVHTKASRRQSLLCWVTPQPFLHKAQWATAESSISKLRNQPLCKTRGTRVAEWLIPGTHLQGECLPTFPQEQASEAASKSLHKVFQLVRGGTRSQPSRAGSWVSRFPVSRQWLPWEGAVAI